MSIGVCYFPEHWPDEDWERDVEAMADAGLEYVRMAEFAWDVLEPERGAFEFEWLDRALELIDDHGMQAVLCTPTASPPRWLVDEHPEILQQDRDGTVREAGSRRHYCFNSPAYREETERVVGRLAERYADDPRVAGWQTDNEYGCHDTAYCYCDDCADAFREWVADRFADADELNEAWGTTFWSQGYDSLSDVDVPRPTPAQDHPALSLAFARFTSDAILDYNRLQTEILREHGDPFVTHNFMHLYPAIDLHEASADLDFLSWDSYPTGHVQQREGEASADELRSGDPDLLALNHDLYRSVGGAPFWVLEQQPGDVNWPPHSPQPGEGAMRLWAHHAVAHGADAVVYFRWRRCLEGQEQYHAGLRRADGSPDRGYDDAATAAGEFEALPDLETPEAPVAIVHDYENLWALDGREHAPDFDYWGLLGAFYDALRARGVAVALPPRTPSPTTRPSRPRCTPRARRPETGSRSTSGRAASYSSAPARGSPTSTTSSARSPSPAPSPTSSARPSKGSRRFPRHSRDRSSRSREAAIRSGPGPSGWSPTGPTSATPTPARTSRAAGRRSSRTRSATAGRPTRASGPNRSWPTNSSARCSSAPESTTPSGSPTASVSRFATATPGSVTSRASRSKWVSRTASGCWADLE